MGVGKLRYKRLVNPIGDCCNGNERLLVAEYLPNDTLAKHLFYWEIRTMEWCHTLEEMNIYINLRSNVLSSQFYYKIQLKHIEIRINGNPLYLNHKLTSPVKMNSSFWTIEDDIMHLTLPKRERVW